MDAKRKLEESGMLRRVLDSKEDCPDTKRRRKNAEDSEISTRRLADKRRLERELRQQELKTSRAVQEGTLRPIIMPTKKYGRKTENLCEPVLAVGATNLQNSRKWFRTLPADSLLPGKHPKMKPGQVYN